MKHIFLGDLHLGKQLPHATREGSQKFTQSLLETLAEVVGQDSSVTYYQMGDLFDQSSVGHATFCLGLEVARNLDFFLTGNHDFNLDLTKRSALACLRRELKKPEDGCGPGIDYVHYHHSQELFEKAILDLKGGTLLLLHAGLQRGDHAGSTENNLTPELLKFLSTQYTHVLSGHEHSAHRVGNVQWTGSFLPFSFGEMSDKFYWVWDDSTPDRAPEPFRVWSVEENYTEVVWPNTSSAPTQFVQLVGECPEQDTPKVAARVRDLLKKPGVFSVKNNVSVVGAEGAGFSASLDETETWEQILQERVKKSSQKRLKELLQEVA
jgi:hypothetical protein